MQKWEYKVMSLFISSSEYRLNTLGDDGWELIGIYREDGSAYAVFKRPK